MPSTAIFALRWLSLRSSAPRLSFISPLKTGIVAQNGGFGPRKALLLSASWKYYPPLPSILATWQNRQPQWGAAQAGAGPPRGGTWAPPGARARSRLGRAFH